MARDSQRQKVYDTEHAVFQRRWDSGAGLTHREAQKFTNKITSNGIFSKLGGPRIVICKNNPKRTSVSAVVGPRSFELASGWGYNKDVILHELSHILIYGICRADQDHGPEFVLILRRLIEQEFGSKVRIQFDIEAEKRGVKWGPNGNVLLQKKLRDL